MTPQRKPHFRPLLMAAAAAAATFALVGCTMEGPQPSDTTGSTTSDQTTAAGSGETSAAGGGGSDAQGIRVGLAVREITNDYNRDIDDGVKAAVEAAGGTVEITDGQTDQTTHNNNIESLINSGVDAVVIQLGDPQQMAPVVAKATAAGIPVVTAGVGSLTPGAITDVGGDESLMGEMLARTLLASIDYKGTIEAFWVPGAPLLETRIRILEAVAADYPDVKIERQPTEHSPAKVQSQMEALLTSHPEKGSIAAVWCAYDQLCSGAVQAIQQAGRSDEIKAAGIDGDRATFQMLFGDNSPFVVTVVQNAYHIGELAGQIALNAIKGDTSGIGPATFTTAWVATRNNGIKAAEDRYGSDVWSGLNLDPAAIEAKYPQTQDVTVMQPVLALG
jgi:ABC-type sugar transport system substrate-binding protein